MTVASWFQVAPLATGLAGSNWSTRHELPVTSIRSSCSRVSGPSGEYRMGRAAPDSHDDQATVVGELWREPARVDFECALGTVVITNGQRLTVWRIVAGIATRAAARRIATSRRRSSAVSVRRRSFTAAPLSSVAARTRSLPPASNSMVTRVSALGSIRGERSMDSVVESARAEPANRPATTIDKRAIRTALNIADTSLASGRLATAAESVSNDA